MRATAGDRRPARRRPGTQAPAPDAASSTEPQGSAEGTGKTAGSAQRGRAAALLASQRRRVFFASTALSLALEVLPYLTGTWETAWYALAATWLPLPLRAAVFLAGVNLVLAAALAPLAFYGGYGLSHAFGLSRQSVRAWWLDWAKGAALGGLLGTLGGGGFLAAVVTAGGGWWWVFGCLVSVFVVAFTFVMPYVFMPIFFKMRPLTDLPTLERVRALLKRAGADVPYICSLDFSRRTVEANAAVVGLGRSRRVVLADTLLAQFPAHEVDAVLAHELGHHQHGDVPRLLVAQLALIWVGLGLAAWVLPAALPVLGLPALGYVPGFPVLLAVAEAYFLATMPLTSWFSRRLESAADRYALELTGDPAAFVGAMQRLASLNLIEARPPRWAELLLGSHPALERRIALAESWRA